MLIKQVYFEDTDCFREGYRIIAEMENGNSEEVSFLDGEPEDAILGRDFSEVYKIDRLLEIAWLAGSLGEEMKYETRSTSDIDEF